MSAIVQELACSKCWWLSGSIVPNRKCSRDVKRSQTRMLDWKASNWEGGRLCRWWLSEWPAICCSGHWWLAYGRPEGPEWRRSFECRARDAACSPDWGRWIPGHWMWWVVGCFYQPKCSWFCTKGIATAQWPRALLQGAGCRSFEALFLWQSYCINSVFQNGTPSPAGVCIEAEGLEEVLGHRHQ